MMINYFPLQTPLTCETRHTFLQQQRNGEFPTYQSLCEILFNFSASPGALTVGCVRQQQSLSPHHNKGNQPLTHTSGPQLILNALPGQIKSARNRQIGVNGIWDRRSSFCFFNAAVCVFWCGTVCSSLCLCVSQCSCVTTPCVDSTSPNTNIIGF